MLQTKAFDDFTMAKNRVKESILKRTEHTKNEITEAYNTYFLISEEYDKNKSHDYIVSFIYWQLESSFKITQRQNDVYLYDNFLGDLASLLNIKLASIKNFSNAILQSSSKNELLNIKRNKVKVVNQSQSETNLILNEFTNSQLVLMFYYFFKHTGIEPRKSTDIAPVAKFLHMITGKKFSNIQCSDFYKKLSKAPNHKNDKSLRGDLIHIKPLFQMVNLNAIVKMIETEINQCSSELEQKTE